jgi:hypothetical protein
MPRRKRTAAPARTEMKVSCCRLRAVVMRSVMSAGLGAAAADEVLLLLVLVSVKRAVTSVSTERPEADWQRVPASSMPQMPK